MRQRLTPVVIAVLILALMTASATPVAAQTPAEAVGGSVANAAANGVTSFISVVDRRTGAVLSQTPNAGAQVASESVMKLFLAAYYLRSYPGGHAGTPQAVKNRLEYMLIYSDDGTASSMFTESAIPTIAAAYGLGSTINATDRPGHWGAARITAGDVTRFLFAADRDPLVGPWLMPVLARTAATGSGADAGFNQYFGLNALSGEHGSKQGWGCDSFWTSPQCAIHSVGYTDRYFVAILQLGGYPDPMRSTSTTSARLIQQSWPPPADGDFVCRATTGEVFRLAGGAPIYVSTWNVFGGGRPCRELTDGEFGALSRYPADGAYLRDPISGAMYRVAGGAPIYVSSWAGLDGGSPAVDVDPAAIDRAGGGGPYDHLRYHPADGTFLRGAKDGAIYRVAGGAPLYVTSWTGLSGQPVVDVDTAAIDFASAGGYFNHLRYHPADGTFLRGANDGAIYRVAGGAPLYVTSWTGLSGQQVVDVDTAAIDFASAGGYFNHLRYHPADGTFLRGAKDGAIYRVAGGAPVYVSTWSAFGGGQTTTDVDTAAIDFAGAGGYFNHLSYHPADGTFLRATSTGAVFRVAGGAPLYLTTWSIFPGGQQVTDIDQAATARAGSGGTFNHLRFVPGDGTFLQGLPGGRIYRVAGGVANYVPSWDPWGGSQPFTPISQQTIDRAGTGGDYNHLSALR